MKLIRRIPKRGFTSPNRTEYAALNIGEIVKIVDGDITPETLAAVGRISGKELVKILAGHGEVGGPRTVKAHAFSAAAKAKIEAAGGTCEIIARAKKPSAQEA